MSIAILNLQNPDKGDVRYKHFIFKSGENHFQVTNLPKCETVKIQFQFNQDSQIIKLLMAVDAIRRLNKNQKIELYIPYFPGARQDRVCNYGESLSVKVYADLINSVGFEAVHIFDAHSEVTPALINNVFAHTNYKFLNEVIADILKVETKQYSLMGLSIPNNFVFISPDAGSNKKIFGASKYFGGVKVVRADKVRDVRDGKIIDTEVFAESLSGKICLIVDDICAGGRTFVELAKKLKEKGAETIYLATSHSEGLAGQNLKDAGIKKFYFGNGIRDIATDDFLMQFDIFSLMGNG